MRLFGGALTQLGFDIVSIRIVVLLVCHVGDTSMLLKDLIDFPGGALIERDIERLLRAYCIYFFSRAGSELLSLRRHAGVQDFGDAVLFAALLSAIPPFGVCQDVSLLI